jgi:TetR/AcrR family transcriptional regulator
MATRPQARLSAADRRKQILDVATELFARQGFQGTTTRQIAERAHVNEALIFRHFPSKQELYWGVLDEKVKQGGKREALEKRLREARSARELFAGVAEDILQRETTMTRLLLFSALENHELAKRFFETYIAKYYETLAEQVAQRVKSGEFRKIDPLLAARGFLGMVIYHFQIQELFGGKRYQKFDAKAVAATLTDIWLTGVSTERLSESRKNGS